MKSRVQGARQNEPDLLENARKLSCEIPKVAEGLCHGSRASRVPEERCCPVMLPWSLFYQRQPCCIFQPFENTFYHKERLVQGSHGNSTLCFLPLHCCASAVVCRSCPRGPSAERFTSVAQKPLLFRVLLLQIVFSSVG